MISPDDRKKITTPVNCTNMSDGKPVTCDKLKNKFPNTNNCYVNWSGDSTNVNNWTHAFGDTEEVCEAGAHGSKFKFCE